MEEVDTAEVLDDLVAVVRDVGAGAHAKIAVEILAVVGTVEDAEEVVVAELEELRGGVRPGYSIGVMKCVLLVGFCGNVCC